MIIFDQVATVKEEDTYINSSAGKLLLCHGVQCDCALSVDLPMGRNVHTSGNTVKFV